MKSEMLKKLVIAEAIALVGNTTKVERNFLDFDDLDPRLHTGCIYGQMTGSCFSPRAHELIKKCAPKLINGEIGGYVTPLIMRKPIKGKIRQNKISRATYWSPIEVFIATEEKVEDVKSLIKFLKGKSKTLTFK